MEYAVMTKSSIELDLIDRATSIYETVETHSSIHTTAPSRSIHTSAPSKSIHSIALHLSTENFS